MSGFVLALVLAAAEKTAVGVVKSIKDDGSLVVTLRAGDQSFFVDPKVSVRIDGKAADRSKIPVGEKITVTWVPDGTDGEQHARSISVTTAAMEKRRADAIAKIDKKIAQRKQEKADAETRRRDEQERERDPDAIKRRYSDIRDRIEIEMSSTEIGEETVSTMRISLAGTFEWKEAAPTISLSVSANIPQKLATRSLPLELWLDEERTVIETESTLPATIGGQLKMFGTYSVKPTDIERILASKKARVVLGGTAGVIDARARDRMKRTLEAIKKEIADRKAGKFAKP